MNEKNELTNMPNSEPEVKPGTEFVIPDDWKDVVKEQQNTMEADRNALEEMGQMLHARHKMFWKIIKEIFPQTDEYACNYNKETQVVKVLYKLPKYKIDQLKVEEKEGFGL